MNTPLLLRRLVLLGAPLPLIVVGLTHPRLDGLSASLAQADVHFALHLALIPLFGLIGLAGSLLTIGLQGRAARISRGAMAVFVTLYAAYATLDGVTVGLSSTRRASCPPISRPGCTSFSALHSRAH